MLHATKGIVLHSIKYSETSIIVRIYTELFGIQSFLFKGIRNSRSKIRPGLFQSLTLLDLVVYHKEKQSLQSVKEVSLAHPYKTIPYDIRKSAVALFINELIYKAIREEEPNTDMFSFLWQSCMMLDETTETVSWFHIHFSLKLMNYLGICPRNNYSSLLPFFNMREGFFQASVPNHPQYLDKKPSRLMADLLGACALWPAENGEIEKWRSGENFPDPGSRSELLEAILGYYQLHLPGFRGVQSHQILHDVLA
jgi:DNA repair protein RecO (recombination protein O)